MTDLNKKKNKFDVIVIGSGISGGWAAKEFCDAGLKTLVLERGGDVQHIKDYPTTLMQPWEFDHLGQISKKLKDENPIASKCYIFTEEAQHFVLKDKEHPYIQEKPFDWIRGYQVGGKSLLWARGTQRWSKYDFEGPARDGFDNHWPIGYDDLAPWYSHVEIFAGISGKKDGLETLPDGEFLKPFEQSCVEKHFSSEMAKHYGGKRPVIISRCAHLTDPQPIHYEQGRGRCMHRNLCERGCPYGGYFSSNASTLPWAMKTGKLTMQPNSVVHSIIYDEKSGKALGVNVVDSMAKTEHQYYAKVIFVNASTINTNLILLNSKSSRFPNGLGNDNGLMGQYIHFHNFMTGMSAEYDGFQDSKTAGITPAGSYIPRFRNVKEQETNFLRGYAAGFSARRPPLTDSSSIGMELKNNLQKMEFGNWKIGSHFMGETIPKASNYVKLDDNQTDDWGVPLARINVGFDDNDLKMAEDYEEQMTEMYTLAGFKNIKVKRKDTWNPGLDIHEMGGVIMGNDPKTSQLNKWNQLHNCKNVFVTDGACMTSNSTQNPSLTYMALTARAANFAVEALKRGDL
jgi:choline dehydrogenase-like flavoprotein